MEEKLIENIFHDDTAADLDTGVAGRLCGEIVG